jgi:ribonucleoside-diphosphate reductase beta chain
MIDENGTSLITRGEPDAQRLPSCMELFRRWQSNRWSADALDFGPDQEQWRTMDEGERQTWMCRLIGLYRGDVAAVDALIIYKAAMARPDHAMFLATQIADEARHVTLFHRFQHEVLGWSEKQIEEESAQNGGWTCPAYRTLLVEVLPGLCGRLRADPRNEPALVEAVTLLHVLVEGGLGMFCLRTTNQNLAVRGAFPTLRQGLQLAARDEVRHFLFGLRFLADAIQEEAGHAQTVLRAVSAYLPLVKAVLGTPKVETGGSALAGETTRSLVRIQRGLHSIGLCLP